MVTACPMKLIEYPPGRCMPQIHMSVKEKNAARKHISLLKKGAIVRCHKNNNDFVSSVFLVPKKDGGYDMILNLKEFNKYAEKIHFKMETLQHILYLVNHNCYMMGLDIVNAFLTVPVNRSICKLFKFSFEGQVYMYTSLPFGYTDSPCISTKILKPVVSKLRSQGHVLTFYLDDFWQSAQSYKASLNTCIEMFKLLTSVGFIPNLKKSQLKPTQCITILGSCLNSKNMLVSLPREKEDGIITLINETLAMHRMSIRHLARVIGKLLSCMITCPFGQLHYRYLEREKLRVLKLNRGRWNSRCRLKFQAREELELWLQILPHSSTPIHHSSPGPTIFMDACSRGWGCFFDGKFTNGHFSRAEESFSINTKETLAILYGFKLFLKDLYKKKQHNTILIMSDSTTAVSYVRKMGGM